MVEALIDHPDIYFEFKKVGEQMGECGGRIKGLTKVQIQGFERDCAIVEVSPDPDVCDFCKLSEYCTESKAD